MAYTQEEKRNSGGLGAGLSLLGIAGLSAHYGVPALDKWAAGGRRRTVSWPGLRNLPRMARDAAVGGAFGARMNLDSATRSAMGAGIRGRDFAIGVGRSAAAGYRRAGELVGDVGRGIYSAGLGAANIYNRGMERLDDAGRWVNYAGTGAINAARALPQNTMRLASRVGKRASAAAKGNWKSTVTGWKASLNRIKGVPSLASRAVRSGISSFGRATRAAVAGPQWPTTAQLRNVAYSRANMTGAGVLNKISDSVASAGRGAVSAFTKSALWKGGSFSFGGGANIGRQLVSGAAKAPLAGVGLMGSKGFAIGGAIAAAGLGIVAGASMAMLAVNPRMGRGTAYSPPMQSVGAGTPFFAAARGPMPSNNLGTAGLTQALYNTRHKQH